MLVFSRTGMPLHLIMRLPHRVPSIAPMRSTTADDSRYSWLSSVLIISGLDSVHEREATSAAAISASGRQTRELDRHCATDATSHR